MGLALILVLLLAAGVLAIAPLRKQSSSKLKIFRVTAGVITMFVLILLVVYYIPFSVDIPEKPVYQIQTDEELIWVEDEEEGANITSLLENLRFRRETIPTNDVLPADQVTKYPIQADEWVMIMIYDGDTEINGLPNRIGGFYFAIPYPQVSRYISFDDNPLTNYRILNAEEHMEYIKIILEKYLAS